MNGLSLFSGVGGLDVAFEACGGNIIAFCEIDPFCQKVLKKHWPKVPCFVDIREVVGTHESFKDTAIDIIYGGFPCQPFSVAGSKRGKEDNRYLWPEFSRLVSEIKPHWVVAENVPGILSLAADDICKDLECMGYEVGIWNFEALSVGAPHRRARIFFVAHAGRRMLQGGSVPGEVRGISEIGAAAGIERPGSPSLSDPDCEREQQQGGSFSHCGRWAGDVRAEAPSNSNCQRREVQRNGVPAEQKLCGTERRGGREPQPRMGGIAYGLSPWLDRYWDWGIPKVAKGIPNRVSRLKALGNAVVPAQAVPIFRAIIEADKECC